MSTVHLSSARNNHGSSRCHRCTVRECQRSGIDLGYGSQMIQDGDDGPPRLNAEYLRTWADKQTADGDERRRQVVLGIVGGECEGRIDGDEIEDARNEVRDILRYVDARPRPSSRRRSSHDTRGK
jgi:hypothetical protein